MSLMLHFGFRSSFRSSLVSAALRPALVSFADLPCIGGISHTGHARTYCSYRSRYRHTAVHIVCISILNVSLVYRQSCVHITPYTKIRHHIAIISILHIYNMVRGHMPTYHGLSNIQTNRGFFFDFQYTVFYTDMPQRSPIFHRQPQYATNIISDMHIEISPSEEAYREEIDMCSRCDIFVLTLIAHISFYLTDTLAYCVNISTYCVYRLSSVPFSAYRFSDLGAYHITRFIRITQILEMYCSISKIYRTCCRVLQTYCILGEKQPWNWGKTACHPATVERWRWR